MKPARHPSWERRDDDLVESLPVYRVLDCRKGLMIADSTFNPLSAHLFEHGDRHLEHRLGLFRPATLGISSAM